MMVFTRHFGIYMSVCMVTHIAREWINRVRLPVLHVVSLTGKMNISLSAFAPENLVSRDGFGSPVPRQPAHLHVVVIVFTLKTVLTSIQYPFLSYSSRQRNEFPWFKVQKNNDKIKKIHRKSQHLQEKYDTGSSRNLLASSSLLCHDAIKLRLNLAYIYIYIYVPKLCFSPSED